MTDSTNKPSIGFWVIGIVALIWNSLGVDGYIQQTYNTERFQSIYTEEKLAFIYNQPSWATAAFAIAVFSSVIGCVLLLLKKKSAKLFFQLGLLAVIVQTIYKVIALFKDYPYDAMEYSMLIMIPIISIFLVWYSKKTIAKGWLK